MTPDEFFCRALVRVRTDEIRFLAEHLGLDLGIVSGGYVGRTLQEKLWHELSYYGSNNIAWILRGGGVAYSQIVRDVCSKKKVADIKQANELSAVVHNESELIKLLFSEMWDHMDEAERQALLETLGRPSMTGKGGVAVAAMLAAELGGFGTYKLALLVANTLARALLGHGLALGANAALMRALGVLVGPIGWVASGAWLLGDLSSPAYRKTLPAVVAVAALRQLSLQRQLVGIMGHGSTGKDSLLKHVFGVDTHDVSPTPGSTTEAATYDIAHTRIPLQVINFPGFGDLRRDVTDETMKFARSCSLVLYLFNEIPQKAELEEFRQFVVRQGVASIVILNKWDKVDEDDRAVVFAETCKRLERSDVLCTMLKPKSGSPLFTQSVLAIRQRVNEHYASIELTPPFVLEPTVIAVS